MITYPVAIRRVLLFLRCMTFSMQWLRAVVAHAAAIRRVLLFLMCIDIQHAVAQSCCRMNPVVFGVLLLPPDITVSTRVLMQGLR